MRNNRDSHPLTDSLINALQDASRQETQARSEVKVLLAYAREIAPKGTFTLETLAQATGKSTNWVRTAYGPNDVAAARQALSQRPALT